MWGGEGWGGFNGCEDGASNPEFLSPRIFEPPRKDARPEDALTRAAAHVAALGAIADPAAEFLHQIG